MRHWAHDLMGEPYAADFRCWHLVRRVFAERRGLTLPENAADVLGLKAAALALGWRQVEGPARAFDIVLMRDARGERHVGVFIEANGRLGVLHNDGHMTKAGPVGGVCFDTVQQLTAARCSRFEYWRHAAA